MGKFESLLNRMDALTEQRMGVTIYLNGLPVRAVEFHFLSEMGPVCGDGISYVIFTRGITPRRNDSVTVNGDTFIVTRILRCNGNRTGLSPFPLSVLVCTDYSGLLQNSTVGF